MSGYHPYEGYPLTLSEARSFLVDGTLPGNFRERVENYVEFDDCRNCDGRKCMGCVFREYDHTCADDCPSCCADTARTGGGGRRWCSTHDAPEQAIGYGECALYPADTRPCVMTATGGGTDAG